MAAVTTCPWCEQDVGPAAGLLCPHCHRHLSRGPRRTPRAAPAVPAPAAETAAPPPVATAPPPEAADARVCSSPGCGGVLPAEAAECPYCGAPAPGAAGGATIAAPWGVLELRTDRPLDLGRDPTFSPFAHELERFDNISRHHARIELRGDGVYVTDFGSTNGTYVDGRRLTPNLPERVDAGAGVRLASNVPFRLPGAAERGAA